MNQLADSGGALEIPIAQQDGEIGGSAHVRVDTIHDVNSTDSEIVAFCESLCDRPKANKNLKGETRVHAGYFGGQAQVDIRRWVPNGTCKIVPTQKGISLSLVRWVQLVEHEELITRLLQKIRSGGMVDKKIQIGGPVMVNLCSPFCTLNLRTYEKDSESGELKPTSEGIVLREFEFKALMEHGNDIKEKMPDIAKTYPCYLDHDNQEAMLMCSECSPWTYEDYISMDI